MSFVTRKMQVNWSWDGVTANLTGYEVAICLAASHPDDSTVIFGRSGRNATSHVFEAVTVEMGVPYKCWVRAVYGEKTSAWVATGSTFTPDETWSSGISIDMISEVGFTRMEGGESGFQEGAHSNTLAIDGTLTLEEDKETGVWTSNEFSLAAVGDLTTSDVRWAIERDDYFHDYSVKGVPEDVKLAWSDDLYDAQKSIVGPDPEWSYTGPQYDEEGRPYPYAEPVNLNGDGQLWWSGPSYTNFVPNAEGVGGGIGVSPPTWQTTVGTNNGMTREVVSVVDGVVTWRFYGTPTITYQTLYMIHNDNTPIASIGDTFTASCKVKLRLDAGSFSARSLRLRGNNNTGSLTEHLDVVLPINSDVEQTVVATRVFNNAATTRAQIGFEFSFAVGSPIDFTISVSQAQLTKSSRPVPYVKTVASPVTVNQITPPVPAIHGDKGVWCGPSYTNVLKNSKFINGGVGSQPTNWTTVHNSVLNGITFSYVDGGENYIVFRVHGTATANTWRNTISIPDVVTGAGDVWTYSVTPTILSGEIPPGGNIWSVITERNSSGTSIASSINFVVSGERHHTTRTLTNANTVSVRAYTEVYIPSGKPIDITIRIEKPQLTKTTVPMPYVGTNIGETVTVASAAGTSGGNGIGFQLTPGLKECFEKTPGPATCTVAALVTMGVNQLDFPNVATYTSVLTTRNAGTWSTELGYGVGSNNHGVIVTGYDGTEVSVIGSSSWSRNEQHLKIVQTNALGTQFRVGNKRIGIDSAIQWSTWANFDGSFNPLTHLRLAFGTTVPIWIKNVMVSNLGGLSEAEINDRLKSRVKYGTYDSPKTVFDKIDTDVYFQKGRHTFTLDTYESDQANKIYLELENDFNTCTSFCPVGEYKTPTVTQRPNFGRIQFPLISQAEPFIFNDKLYLYGGHNGSAAISLVSVLNLDGTLSDEFDSGIGARYHYTGGMWNNKFYMFGGYRTAVIDEMVEFDPITKTSQIITTDVGKPASSNSHAGGIVDNHLYVLGGFTTTTVATCARRNMNTGVWEPLAAMPTATQQAVCWVYENKFYILGGRTGSGTTQTNMMQVYDIVSNTWVSFPFTKIQAQGLCGFAKTNRDSIFIFGGYVHNNVRNNVLHEIFFKDLSYVNHGSLSQISARYGSYCWYHDDKLYIHSGNVGANGAGGSWVDEVFTFGPFRNKQKFYVDVPVAGKYDISVYRTGVVNVDLENKYKVQFKADWINTGLAQYSLNSLLLRNKDGNVFNLCNAATLPEGLERNGTALRNAPLLLNSGEADPHYNNVVLCLNANKPIRTTTVEDCSLIRRGVTATNCTFTTVNSEDCINFSSYGYLDIADANSDLALGAGDFTIEMAFYRTANIETHQIMFQGGGSGDLGRGFSVYLNYNTIRCSMTSNGTSWNIMDNTPVGSLGLNTFYHLAFVREGGVFRVFINGSLIYTKSDLGTTALHYAAATRRFFGDMSYLQLLSFRWTKGVARYTDTFTSPTRPYYGIYQNGFYVSPSIESTVYDFQKDFVESGSLLPSVSNATYVKTYFRKSEDGGVTWTSYAEMTNNAVQKLFSLPDRGQFITDWGFWDVETKRLQDFFEANYTLETRFFDGTNWLDWKTPTTKQPIPDVNQLSMLNIKNCKYQYRVTFVRARFGGAVKMIYISSKIGNVKAFASESGATNDSLWRSAQDYTKMDGGVIEASSRIIIGDNNIILDGKSGDGITNAIYVSEDGGPGGGTGFGGIPQDYVKLHSGNIEFFIAAEGMHHKYMALNKCIMGICNAGDWVTITSEDGPVFWKKKPNVFVYPNTTLIYDASNSMQSQTFQCYVEAVEKVAEDSMQWKFKPKMQLALGSGQNGVNVGQITYASGRIQYGSDVVINGDTKTLQMSVSGIGTTTRYTHTNYVIQESNPSPSCATWGWPNTGYWCPTKATSQGYGYSPSFRNAEPGSGQYAVQFQHKNSSVWNYAPSLNFTTTEFIAKIRLVNGPLNYGFSCVCSASQPTSVYSYGYSGAGVKLEYISGDFTAGQIETPGTLNYIAIGE